MSQPLSQPLNKNYHRYKDFFLNIASIYRSRPTVKAYLEIMLPLIAIIIFFLFAIQPTVLTILELNKEIKYREDSLAKMQQKINDLDKAGQVLFTYSEAIEKINRAIPNTPDPASILNQITILASLNSLTVTSLSTPEEIVIKGIAQEKISKKEESAFPESIKNLPVTITVSGKYENINLFLSGMENMRRVIKFESLSINSSRSEENTTILLTINGDVAYLDLVTKKGI